ncbi:MAG: thiamine diphosphokinase [Chloroflexota bacterium]
MRALVLADGLPPTRADLDRIWPDWDQDVALVIAADGGARLADALGVPIDLWVGDGDSLGAAGQDELRRRGIPMTVAATDKDETDTELGLLAALDRGATRVTLIGVLGGPRPDHALVNMLLLGHPRAIDAEIEILDPTARIRLLAANAEPGVLADLDLGGREGDLVSLVPLEDVVGVTTMGLRFPLTDATLKAGSSLTISNVRTSQVASVSIRAGRLLVLEVPATLAS